VFSNVCFNVRELQEIQTIWIFHPSFGLWAFGVMTIRKSGIVGVFFFPPSVGFRSTPEA